MRCPTCGTENAPDSRFCGECGARVQKSSVAPTHKITDDAPFPGGVQPAPAPYATDLAAAAPYAPPVYQPPTAVPAGPGYEAPVHVAPRPALPVAPVAPVAPAVGSSPPRSGGPGPASPASATEPPRPEPRTPPAPATRAPRGEPQPRAPRPADSLAPARPRTRWALILTLLVLDLGLAAAGAWLLREGLASPAAPGATSSPPSSDATTDSLPRTTP